MSLVEFRFEDDDPIVTQAWPGENLMNVVKRRGIALSAPCGGTGSCGKCRVRILAGKLESQPSFYITAEDYAEGWRLACLSRISGDVTLYIEL